MREAGKSPLCAKVRNFYTDRPSLIFSPDFHTQNKQGNGILTPPKSGHIQGP